MEEFPRDGLDTYAATVCQYLFKSSFRLRFQGLFLYLPQWYGKGGG